MHKAGGRYVRRLSDVCDPRDLMRRNGDALSTRAAPDLIFDSQGTSLLDGDVDVDLAVAAPGARIVLFGNASGTALDALPPLGSLMGGLLSQTGFSLAALAAGIRPGFAPRSRAGEHLARSALPA